PCSGQFHIDFGEQFGVEQGAVFCAARVIDAIADTKVVQSIWAARMFAARKQKRVDQPILRDRWTRGARKLGVQEVEIEPGIVGDEPRITQERNKFVSDGRE